MQMLTTAQLRDEAARCRRLARGIGDPLTTELLAALAEVCAREADEKVAAARRHDQAHDSTKKTPPQRGAIAGLVALHPSMLPMTMPPMMPAAIISGTSVVGERRTNYSAVAVAVYWRIIVIVRISAVIGRSIATIVSWCITAGVAVSRAVGVRAGSNAADDGSSN